MSENNELKEFKLYPFMNDPRFQEMEDALQYVDYFITVKQDILIKIDGVQCAITNAKLNIAESEAEELLETNFKEKYGKDNEGIRKAHLQRVNKELYEQLAGYQFQKTVLQNQLNVLNDMIRANQSLIDEHYCTCNCGD